LVNSIFEEQEQRSQQLGIMLMFDGDKPVCVESDPLLLSRVIRNLLQNAFDHAYAKNISITWRVNDHIVRIEITDDGVGIPRQERRAIFKEFHQVGESAKLGMGLGLAIVKQLCELMDINLGIQHDIKKGSCFFLEMKQAVDIKAQKFEISNKGNLSDQSTLFLVEDDVNILEPMTSLLMTWGYRVYAFGKPSEALKQIECIKPDIIISDYRFPESLNGLNFIAEVHSILGNAVPAILITADTTLDFESEKNQVLDETQQEKTHVQFKPVLPAKLKLLIQHCLESNI